MKEKYEYVYEPAQHSSTLIIKNVNSKDKGDYTFLVKNNLGTCKSVCFLDVIRKSIKSIFKNDYKLKLFKHFLKQLLKQNKFHLPNINRQLSRNFNKVYLIKWEKLQSKNNE